jgi:hypothetical protein
MTIPPAESGVSNDSFQVGSNLFLGHSAFQVFKTICLMISDKKETQNGWLWQRQLVPVESKENVE